MIGQVLDEPGCQRIVAVYGRGLRARWRRWRRRPVDWEVCGLTRRHDGVCVPFVPGYYLRAPFAHPLDLWLAWRPRRGLRWRCPDGCPTRGIDTDGPTHDMQYEDGGWRLHDVIMEWRFTPCGHTFRDILPHDSKEPSR